MSINKVNTHRPISIPALHPLKRHDHQNRLTASTHEHAQRELKEFSALANELISSIFKVLPKGAITANTKMAPTISHVHKLLQRVKSLSKDNSQLLKAFHDLPPAKVKSECQALINQLKQKHHLSSEIVKPLHAALATNASIMPETNTTSAINNKNNFVQNLNANISDLLPVIQGQGAMAKDAKAIIPTAKLLYKVAMFSVNFQAMVGLIKGPVSTLKEIASNIGS
jgi:hypothetical protein